MTLTGILFVDEVVEEVSVRHQVVFEFFLNHQPPIRQRPNVLILKNFRKEILERWLLNWGLPYLLLALL